MRVRPRAGNSTASCASSITHIDGDEGRMGGRGASPKVDLKAEMQAAGGDRAATPAQPAKDAAASRARRGRRQGWSTNT